MYQEITLLGTVLKVRTRNGIMLDVSVAGESYAALYRVVLYGKPAVEKEFEVGNHVLINRGRFKANKYGQPISKDVFQLTAYTGFARPIQSSLPIDNYTQATIIGTVGETYLTDTGGIVLVHTKTNRQKEESRVRFYVEIDRDTLRHTYIKNGVKVVAYGMIINDPATGGPARRELENSSESIYLIRAINIKVIR